MSKRSRKALRLARRLAEQLGEYEAFEAEGAESGCVISYKHAIDTFNEAMETRKQLLDLLNKLEKPQ